MFLIGILIGPGGLLFVVPYLFAVPVSVLWVGLEKRFKTKLGCEKYFCRVMLLSTAGDALRVRKKFMYPYRRKILPP